MLLGIDPGPTQSAWMDYRPSFTGAPGEVVRFGISPNKEIEARIAHQLTPESNGGYRVICEDVSMQGGKVGATTFSTAKAIGRFGLRAEMAGIPFEEMERATAKEFILGARVGDDATVRAALCKRYGVAPDAAKSAMGHLKGISTHVWSALAVVVAWDIRETMRRREATLK